MRDRDLPFAPARGGVVVRVRLTPRAGRNRIDGVAAGADGAAVLKAAVSAAPEKGRANDALLRLLAKEWRLPRTALSIAAGAGARNKKVAIAGDAPALIEKLTQWTREHHG